MKRGRPTKYRWEEWFQAPTTVLQRGIHYTITNRMMAQTVRNKASKLDIPVRVVRDDERNQITIWIPESVFELTTPVP